MSVEDLSKPLKTWSHLAANKRRPTEYEIVSTNILWNTPNSDLKWSQGANTPIIKWRREHRDGSPVKHNDWNAFRDPDQMVYRTYNLMQDGQEVYVDGLLNEYSNNEHDLTLSESWLGVLAQAYTPARYLIHSLQMSLGYLVALAPCSTIANPLMFECADQVRWLSRIAYRTAELNKVHPGVGFGTAERSRWEGEAIWDGFLELTERNLIAWDWNEQFFVLHCVLKPAIDEAFIHQLGKAARAEGDLLTGMLLDAQYTDSERSRRFAAAVMRFLCSTEDFDNKSVFDEWHEKWSPLGDRAIEHFCMAFNGDGTAAAAAKESVRLFRENLGFR